MAGQKVFGLKLRCLPALIGLMSALPASAQPGPQPSNMDAYNAAGVLSTVGIDRGRPEAMDSFDPNQSGVINAGSMGLVCDGKNDNAQVFDAIFAKVSPSPGQTVFFPAALQPCLTSRPIVAASGTAYIANPGSVTLRPTSDSRANPVLFLATNVSGVSVQGLDFDGAQDTIKNSNNVIVVFRSSQVVFRYVTVKDTSGIGIIFSTSVSASGVTDSNIVDVGNRWKRTGLLSDQRQGVAFCCGDANHGNFVTGTRFADVGLDAISFADQIDFLASDNTFINVGGGVAGVSGSNLDPGILNHGLAGGAAIYGATSAGVKVVNNLTDGACGNGIDLYTVDHAEIVGNTARHSGGNGIAFAAGTGARILRNLSLANNQARSMVLSAPQAGIYLTGGLHGDPAVRDVTISENISTDDQTAKTQNYGVQLQNGSVASGIHVDQSNRLIGNVVAEFGEGLSGYRHDKGDAP